MPKSLQPPHHLMALLSAVLLSCCFFSSISADDYTYGRATFYDDNQQGSCKFYNNIPEWYGAWPDPMAGFPNCGSCWEVSCVDSEFSDGYGATMQRSSACYDTSKSVVIKIVDSCPCVHQNFYSNQRWCCGDMNHLDLGRRAFQELADEKWGVIGLRWKPASCDQLGPRSGSSQAAPAPSNSQGGSVNGNSGSSSSSNNDNTNNNSNSNGNNGGSSNGDGGWHNWKPKQRSFGDWFARWGSYR